jgi:hypothetical protein
MGSARTRASLARLTDTQGNTYSSVGKPRRGAEPPMTRKRIRNKLRGAIPQLFVFGKALGLLYSKRSFLRNAGYTRSVATKQPCRADGAPIPWMNYPVIAFLEDRLTPDLNVFEYGSGNSTRFFASRVRSVVSVECDPAWYETVAKGKPENVELILCHPYERRAYLNVIAEQGRKFDVIVVDAEDRELCLEQAPRWATQRGVIILDDAARPAYASAIEKVLDAGFKKLDFDGLKPGGIRAYRTTVFYRADNVLGL